MDAGCTITWVSSACFRFLAAFEEQKNLLEFFLMPVLCWISQELFGICSWLGSHPNCMARFGLLAGVATAALGALCSYEARVLHLHSVVPGDTFQVWILPCVMFAVSRVFYFGFITPHQKSLLCAPEFYSFSMNTVPGMLRKIFTIWFGLVWFSAVYRGSWLRWCLPRLAVLADPEDECRGES